MNVIPRSFDFRQLTFRRAFPYAFFTMIFALAVRQCTLIDPDFWWHLQTGHDILQSGSIPHVDIYSFTKAGSEWITHEWLSEIFIYGVFKVGGWGLLVGSFSAIFTASLFITYRLCAGRPYGAGLAIALAAAASSPFVGVRPQILTLFLASIFLWVLSDYSRGLHNRRIWTLVPLMLLWVNLHAGFALGLGLTGLFIVRFFVDGQRQLIKRLGFVFIACLAVVPINPNGFRLISYPFQTLASPSMAAYIDEWASPNFHDSMFLPFALFMLLLLAALALSGKRVSIGETLLLLVASLGALRSARHIPIFSLIAAPILSRQVWDVMVSRGWDKAFTRPELPATAASLTFAILFVCAPLSLAFFRIGQFVKNERSYEASKYPVAAVELIKQKQIAGPIFNDYTWGGYLIRQLYPTYRVYVDGRADVYGDEFLTETVNIAKGEALWREALDRRAVRTVLISPRSGLANLLRNDNSWERLYEDEQAVLFSIKQNHVASAAPR